MSAQFLLMYYAVRPVQRLSCDRHPDHSHRHHIDSFLGRSVVPVKFLLVSFNLTDKHETCNALVVVWFGRKSTLRTAKHDT